MSAPRATKHMRGLFGAHTNWQNENSPDKDGDYIRPPYEIGLVDLRSNHTKGETDGKGSQEPPLGGLLVLAHQLQMDVRLLVMYISGSQHNVSSVEDENVNDRRDE